MPVKRDMDLVRNILLRLEESEKIRNDASVLKDLSDEPAIQAHLEMLQDAGFLEQKNWKPFPQGAGIRLGWRITWAGHEFLDTVRDPEIWRKTKSGAEKLGSWTIKLLGEMASGFIRMRAQELGLPIS
jgi:hypothetical protein